MGGPEQGGPETYFKEGGRRPPHPLQLSPDASHANRYREAAGVFATGSVPPLMTGHWLMKQGQTTRARTWTG